MKNLFKLYWAFFKIGLFTIGGGYAMLPLMEREAVENNKWVEKEEMLDIYTISQCTPGVIAVNTATFIGKKVGGFFGALFATLGVVSPSLIIITVIASFFNNYTDNPYVIKAFIGIRVAVAALILNSTVGMIRKGIKNPYQIGIMIAGALTMIIFNVSPIIVIIVAGIFGLFIFDVRADKEETNE
ncbi:MAG: chromate transporter [Clostridia bacterium]|nr:chromate transporter [Clostridia bacterium]